MPLPEIYMTIRTAQFRKLAIPVLNLAYHSGLFRLAGRFYAGCGVIFSLHRIVEPGHPVLYPGHMIHADALDRLLLDTESLGWETVGIDEAYRRLSSGNATGRRFACFTCDDGYADNLTVALPVFRRHKAPVCVYAIAGLLERRILHWPAALHELALKAGCIEIPAIGDAPARVLDARTFQQKLTAYRTLDGLCHRYGKSFLPLLQDLFRQHRIDAESITGRDALNVAQLRQLAADPLVTIGAHSVMHERLSQMPEPEVRRELVESRSMLENMLQMEVRHFAYPFGRSDACGPREFALVKQAGFRTAVTTRQGNIFPEHCNYLECLPRRSVPLNRIKTRTVLFGVQTVAENSARFQTN